MNTKAAFSDTKGFGKYKNDALELLGNLIDILDGFKISYFFISGTLLGLVRHNDFIPWDDDIDIIVSEDFIHNLDKISDKIDTNGKHMIYTQLEQNMYKFCCRDKIIPIGENYHWPFIDVFIYRVRPHDRKINFFDIDWDYGQFFPPSRVAFQNMIVSIPHNPKYFLEINYGHDYLDLYQSPVYDHKNDRVNDDIYYLYR